MSPAAIALTARLLVLLAFLLAFTHFFHAGARTFERTEADDTSAGLAQFSFLVTGSIATLLLAYRVSIHLWNGVAAMGLLAGSIALYEWARRTVRERRFPIAWSGEVPDTLCTDGPYAFIRHPFYLSYILAFLAVFIAMPSAWTLAIFVFNTALYTHAAVNDERGLAQSDFGPDYARYKRKTGMFFPRVFRRLRGAD